MKYLVILLSLVNLSMAGQTVDEIAVLKHEVLRCSKEYAGTETVVNDSLLISRHKNLSLSNYPNLKERLVKFKLLSDDEAAEVFGSDTDNLFNLPDETEMLSWEPKDFSNLRVKFFTHHENKIPPSTISLSDPVFRKDNKYAMIVAFHTRDRGSLSFYKNTGSEWVAYKSIEFE